MKPGQTGTYRFRATQYGSTWYHSHYSLQASPSDWHLLVFGRALIEDLVWRWSSVSGQV